MQIFDDFFCHRSISQSNILSSSLFICYFPIMRHIIILILALFSHISVALALVVSISSPTQLTALVDTAFHLYQQHHQADWTVAKQEGILTKAHIYLQTTADPLLKTALEHLIMRVGERKPHTQTSPETPVNLAQDPLSYEAGNKTILAGVESPIVGKLSYTAQNEAILIDTFIIT